MPTIPSALRAWFIAHFVVDMLAAIPLFFWPEQTLALLGWKGVIDPVAIRLVASAFFAIGTTSFLMREADVASYRAMLSLKQLWSAAAVVGLIWNLWMGAPRGVWLAFATFLVFGSAWNYYAWKLRA